MIFVVKPVVRRSYEDLNAPNNKVLVLPPDCTYDIVNDYNRRNMVVIKDCGAEENKIE